MLYYYAKKNRICLIGHFTIIFYYRLFVKQSLKYSANLPRFASQSAAFLVILFPHIRSQAAPAGIDLGGRAAIH